MLVWEEEVKPANSHTAAHTAAHTASLAQATLAHASAAHASPVQSLHSASVIAAPATITITPPNDELLELIRQINGQQKGRGAKAGEPDNPEHPGLPPAA